MSIAFLIELSLNYYDCFGRLLRLMGVTGRWFKPFLNSFEAQGTAADVSALHIRADRFGRYRESARSRWQIGLRRHLHHFVAVPSVMRLVGGSDAVLVIDELGIGKMLFNRRKVLAGASVGVGTTLLPKQVSRFWHDTDGLDGLPLDGNLLNVRDFGATGDGTTDDSAAILAAVAALPMYTFPHKLITQIIYFPVGTYLVSDTIQRIVGTVFYANVPIIGEDRNGTIIKLADNATGFTSSGSPRP